MAYFVHIPEREQDYLDRLPVSPQAKKRIERFILNQIANVSDEFRNHPRNRIPDSWFRVRLQLFDEWGGKRLHAWDFYVSDAHAEVGVLLIGFIDPVERRGFTYQP